MTAKNKGKNMLNLGKELAQQSKAVLNLPKEKLKNLDKHKKEMPEKLNCYALSLFLILMAI
ncbi:hypothetical protein AAULH_12296 [Lactobacillus helveticus MTCC 5463]|nr:hypothetical protein AAULH_12296 [Lactobacillus helveticus MTCC 5463]